MNNYKILDAYWYTPTFPGADPLLHALVGLPSISIVFVAIESGNNKWKCYMGWVPAETEKALAEQAIAAQGCKVAPEVAYAHFPALERKSFTT